MPGRCRVVDCSWTPAGRRQPCDNIINLYQYTHTAMQKMCSGRRAGKGHASLRFAWNKKATCARARPRPTVLAQARCVERAAGKLRGRGDQLATDRVSWARSSRTTYPRWCPLHVMATYSPRRRTHPSSSLRGGSPSTSPSALSASPAQAASLSTSVEDTKGEAERLQSLQKGS